MTRRLDQLVTSLTGTALTALLLVGPPWLLTTYVGPPIPSSWPDLDTLRTITTIGVTDTFVITTLAVIVWIAWAQLAAAIVTEAIAALRRRPAVRLPLLPGAQPLAARLVAATLLLITVLQPRPITVAAPLELTVATAAPAFNDDQPSHLEQAGPPASETQTRTIVAGERVSWWSLAEAHLGDGLRWREIRDLNTGRTDNGHTGGRSDVDGLEPGRRLLVPADDHTSGHEPPDINGDAPADPSHEWEVQPGEHFWHIATTTLEQAWGRTPTDAEIVPYWQQLIEVNRARLAPPGDPDLIHPGQRFELPPVPADPHPTAPAAEPPANGGEHLEGQPDAGHDATPGDHDPPGVTDGQPPDDGRPHAIEQSDAPPSRGSELSDTDPSTTATPPPAPHDTVDRDQATAAVNGDTDSPAPVDGGRGSTPLGVPAGAAPAAIAAAVAAAGVVALVRRRRRTRLQQRPAGWRLPTPAPAVARQLATLQQVAPDDEVLDDLAALLATLPAEVNPPLVVIHDDGPISLIDVDADLPAPWTHDPGEPGEPVRWTARIGDRGPCRSIGLPLLITLGHTGSSTVLANLGAIGILPLGGPADQVTARLRAMTLELATSRLAGPLEITVCDDHRFGDLDQIATADDPHDAIAATLADTEASIIDDDRLPRIVVCHTPTGIDLPAAAARFCGLLTPGAIDDGGWGLRLDGGHGWLHVPDGDTLPLTLPDLEGRLIADELDTLADDHPLAPEADDPTPEVAADPAADVAVAAPYCRIAVLGPIVVTCDGTETDRLTPIARQLLTYLATHRDGVTLEQLDAAMWPELPPSTGGQRARTALTRLRRLLGDAPDGQPLLPRRAHADDPVTLSEHVGTDLDHAFALLATARRTDDPDQALEVKLAALALIRGQPFTGLTVSWSVDIEQRAIAQLQDAAMTVAEQLNAVGDHDRAVWAIQQGLKLCDPTEPLYVAWARIEHARGRADRIPQLWRRLRRLYADDADEIAGIMTTPTTHTERAFTQLIADT